MVKASVPSRVCLFGEHQDYLGLEVIAAAIDLRFCASVTPREDMQLQIRIRDRALSALGQENPGRYQTYTLDLSQPQVYEGQRDYFRSVVNVLTHAGYHLSGADVVLDSEIPIGKGMCSSTAMVMALMAGLAAQSGRELEPMELAKLGWQAEVAEFGEPGGMMDHYAGALGGILHLDFSDGVRVEKLPDVLKEDIILFDSLEEKDTLSVLRSAKTPSVEGLKVLAAYGVHSVRDLAENPLLERRIGMLPEEMARRVRANVDNYRLQRMAYQMLSSGEVSGRQLGGLLNRHQTNLRDGLGISTPKIDHILEMALANGAYGGKINGSGGGGCAYCYAPKEKSEGILKAAEANGIPAKRLSITDGVRIQVQ